MAAFLSAAAAAIGSTSVGSALVRILIAYGISRLINKANDNGNGSTFNETGVRVQAAPDTTNPIPLVYGSAYLGGKITDAYLTNENKTMWYALTLTEVPHETTALSGNTITTSFGDIFMNGQQVYFKDDGITVDYTVNSDGIVDTSARDLIKIYLYKRGAGNPTLPQYFLDKPTPPALPGYAFNVMPNWDNTFLMRELAFALVRVDYNRDKGISGLPDLKFNVANTLYRPGDAIYSYLINEISGGAIPADNIDTTSLLALNDYADDTVSYLDEADNTVKTLGNRYQINGVVDPKNSVLQNLQRLAANTGCFINYDITTGKWGVVINRDTATTLHFDDSNIISGIDLTGTSLDNMYNSVEVQFPHRELRDQMDTIRIDLPSEYLNANEPPNVLRLQMDLLNEPLQARELGYLELYQNRMDRVVTFTTDYSKINTEAGDVITITSDVYGWTNQPFRVMRVREVESDEGGLAVEITAQEYDATIYTAGGQPRRPRVPTEPIGIPSIGVIGTPLAPTITTQNSVAVPAVVLTANVPSGLVDRMEYWYSSDNGTTWLVGDTDKNANGAPFNQDDTSQVRLPTLITGTYLFKVRAGNESGFGEFSPATTSFAWEPIQVTDQVTADTTVDSGLGSLLPILGMGALAYLAYKTLYPELLKELSQTDLGKLLGIQDPAEIAAAQAALEKQAAAYRIVTAGNVSMSAGVDDTLTFIAGNNIEITVDDIGHEITISATGAAGGGVTKVIAGNGIIVTPDEGTGEVTISIATDGTSGGVDADASTDGVTRLEGSIFPTVYTNNSTTHQSIFTHNRLAFASSSYNGVIKNVIGLDAIVTPIRDEGINLKNKYYTYCDYDASKSLPEQNWENWRLFKDPIETTIQVATGNTTNPPYVPTYKVDGEYDCGGTNPINPTTSDYDFFVPDIQEYTTKTIYTKFQELKVYRGKILLIGVSNWEMPDNTPFNTNTIFGLESLDYTKATTYTATRDINFNQFASSGSVTVGTSLDENDILWYNSDNNFANWNKVSKVTFEGTAQTDVTNKGKFVALNYGDVNGTNKFLALRDFTNNSNEIASSSDGINWVEHGTAISDPFDVPTSLVRSHTGWYTNNYYFSGTGTASWSKSSIFTTIGSYFGSSDIVFKGDSTTSQPTIFFKYARGGYGNDNTLGGHVIAVNANKTEYKVARPGWELPNSLIYRIRGAAFDGSNTYYFAGLRGNDGYTFTPYLAVKTGTIYDDAAGNGSSGFYTYYTFIGIDILTAQIGNILHYNVSSEKLFLRTNNNIYIVNVSAALNGVLSVGHGLTSVYSGSTLDHTTFSSSNTTTFSSDTNGNIIYGVGSNAWVAKSSNFNATYSDIPIAYKTNYYYPGVSGTTTINRTGTFGLLGQDGICPQYTISWTT